MHRIGPTLMWSAIIVIGIPLLLIFGLVTIVAGFTAGAITEIKALWSWRVHHKAGPWVYSLNPTTGQRRAVYARDFSGYVPLDWHWLREGDLLVDDAGRRIIVAGKPLPVSIAIRG